MKFKDIIKAISALVVLVVFGIIVWSLFTSMVKVFGEYTSSVEPAIVVAFISGLGAIIVNAISKNSERKSQEAIKVKERKTEIYESFLNELFGAGEEKNIKSVFAKYKGAFAVNSSDDTYKEFIALERKCSNGVNTDRLIVSIRNEMKLSNKKNKE